MTKKIGTGGDLMEKVIETMKENYIFAVIRGETEEDAFEISKAAVLGGIKNLEITFSTPNAANVMKDLIEEYAEDDTVVVGAGTVMNLDQAQAAYDVGAKYLVSPHFSPEVAKFAVDHNIDYMPGCATVTEIVGAMDAGCEIIKVFPGGQLGPSFIKNVHGPIPEVNLMPSGGVSLENIKEWKDAGAASVGVGSALSSEVEEKGYESVTAIAKQFVAALEGE